MPYDPHNLTVQFRIGQDHLGSDLNKVADTIQKSTTKAFKASGGASGLAGADPTNAILGILGKNPRVPFTTNMDKLRAAYAAPFIGRMRGIGQASLYGKTQGGPHTPALPPFMQNPNFFKKQPESDGIKRAEKGLFMFGAKILAVVGTLDLAHKVLDEFRSSVENARQLYAKSLTTGIGLGQTTRRSLLAGIIGVSETDVYRFGAAMNYLNPKIAWASKKFTETAVPLTELSYKLKIVDENLKAAAASIVTRFAPAIERLLEKISGAIIGATDTLTGSMDKWAAAQAFVNKNKGFAVTRDFQKGDGPLSPSQYGFQFQGLPLQGKQSEMVAKMFAKFQANFHPNQSTLPQPVSFMKQLGASSIERMGLIAGSGRGADPSAQTAQNTKKMAIILGELLGIARSRGKSDSFNPFVTGASHL